MILVYNQKCAFIIVASDELILIRFENRTINENDEIIMFRSHTRVTGIGLGEDD